MIIQDYYIRNAEIEDLPIIVDIYNSTIASRMVTADTAPVTIEERLDWFRRHDSESRPLWIVERDQHICGWVSFESFYGRAAYNSTSEVSIYIHKDYRGKGLGRILLQSAIDACPSLNIKTLLGYIFGHNLPSLKLFKGFGFSQWAFLPKVAELDGIERDLVILGKRVG